MYYKLLQYYCYSKHIHIHIQNITPINSTDLGNHQVSTKVYMWHRKTKKHRKASQRSIAATINCAFNIQQTRKARIIDTQWSRQHIPHPRTGDDLSHRWVWCTDDCNWQLVLGTHGHSFDRYWAVSCHVAHQHILGYLVPYTDVADVIKERSAVCLIHEHGKLQFDSPFDRQSMHFPQNRYNPGTPKMATKPAVSETWSTVRTLTNNIAAADIEHVFVFRAYPHSIARCTY